MTQINPKISQELLNEIKNQTSKTFDVAGIRIKTCKGVFPPKSMFSKSSVEMHAVFGDFTGKDVLDMGTGTGVQAIQAVKAGARRVFALDINPAAVSCARQNVELNNAGDSITVMQSDLFDSLGQNKFDVVIANLPITDFLIEGVVESALYDPDYKIHKRFFMEVGNHLNNDGFIMMAHTNFKGENDFEEFEKMLLEYRFKPETYYETEYAGYLWRTYKIVPII